MSALEDMVGNMLKKALPPEVMELLAPEKIKEFGEKLNAFVVDIRQNQSDILHRLDRIEKGLGNDGRNDTGSTGTDPIERIAANG